jgi:hypothetical protein
MGCVARLDHHYLIYNMNLAYGECIRLDCCNMITTTGDYDMTIITLSRLYFVFSFNSLLPMPCPCSTGDVHAVDPHASQLGHIFHQEWALKWFGPGSWWASGVDHLPRGEPEPKLWVGPDLPLELCRWRAHGLHLAEQATGWSVGPRPDLMPHLGLN